MLTHARKRAGLQSIVLHSLAALAVAATPIAATADLEEDFQRVRHALETNPSMVLPMRLDACLARFEFAVGLYESRHRERAARSLRSCFYLLAISDTAPLPKVAAPPDPAELRARATREIEGATTLEPDVANGLRVYRECAACHGPEGWGLSNGSVPQIAGQHRTVVIKQLADIRAGNRDTVLMAPYAAAERIGGTQAIADVAAYIDTLEISVGTGKGPGTDLEFGARLYAGQCASCHGAWGEGKPEQSVPRIQAQHFNYLVRQFEWIRDGKRRNANPAMAAQIQSFGEREVSAVLDHVSRLDPPEELQAPPGWRNPDFEQ